MKAEELRILENLLTEPRVLSLGVVVDGRPHVGLLPFVTTSDFGSVVVHASQLARHSRGLQQGSRFSILIHSSVDDEKDALEVPRVTISGTVSPEWANRDIGIISNDPEPMYVAVSNTAGDPAVVYHDDPDAAQTDTWTEWIIPLQNFADQGIDLSDVNRIAIGFGTKNDTTTAGGSGTMYFDDIRLYRPR